MNYAEMPAGPEMDRLVAEQVMGWIVRDLYSDEDRKASPGLSTPHYYDADGSLGLYSVYDFRPSTKIAHAWQVMEKMRSVGNYMIIEDCATIWDAYIPTRTNMLLAYARAQTASLAICRCSLMALKLEGK